ncbi:hypothetical protein JHK87_039069 [Glycine soja]|nr:hypothetical protein JHK87_039069 [Glycine soja]
MLGLGPNNQVAGSGLPFEFVDGCQSQFSTRIRTTDVVSVAALGVVHLDSLNKSMKSETTDVLMPLQCSGTRRNYTPLSACGNMSDNVAMQEGPELYIDESSILLQSISNMMNVDCQEFEEMTPLYGTKYEG